MILYVYYSLLLYFSLEIQKEIASVKKEYHANKLKKDKEQQEEKKQEAERSETFREYKEEYDKYKDKKKTLPKKGAGREEFTLNLLAKFKEKLHSAKEQSEAEENENKVEDQDDVDDEKSW